MRSGGHSRAEQLIERERRGRIFHHHSCVVALWFRAAALIRALGGLRMSNIMDSERENIVRAKLAALKTFIRNVVNSGSLMDDNRTRSQYQDIYEDIEITLDDPNLSIYAPGISGGTSYGAMRTLWPEHQVELVNSGTRLISYIEAVLDSKSASNHPSPPEQIIAPSNIFISHGRKSNALDLVEDFIRALGLIPVIVMNQPSQGMSVDTKVSAYMKACVSAIVLATGDDKVEGSTFYQPRQNVIHEIGLAQQMLTNRITYLLEENTEFPSNITPKVYERFTRDNLSTSFIAIVRDLKAFGVL
ncbi:MAG TPA: TIR domain-containing protein [Pyrinomonadaceae bacterium]|nr:TIR domain-containing protein [Pyrinomonadaceae bacterium]